MQGILGQHLSKDSKVLYANIRTLALNHPPDYPADFPSTKRPPVWSSFVISRFPFRLFGLLVYGVLVSPPVMADDDRGIQFFESKIRPVLVEQCYECHSAKALEQKKLKGGLLLDSRQGVLTGGDSGPAVVPGKLKDSLILGALKHEDYEMPPSGKLSDKVIADFSYWVKIGAPDPRVGTEVSAKMEMDFEKARSFWAFQSPKRIAPPTTKTKDWSRTEIDPFVLAKLEQAGLAPVGPANKRAWIRRATFDLIGLPPTPKEIQNFLEDRSSNAYETVIDRLLSSPHYGERWGRHWLDVARYAEDQAHTFAVKRREHAHQYRDWVIQAFNEDMPYDQFVRMQLAADLIPDETDTKNQRLAGLGLLGLGAIYYKNSDKAKAIADELDDRVDTVTRGFLGLTVSCARCHDHKYDPIPTQDYYSLAGIFYNTCMVDKPLADAKSVETRRAAEQVVKDSENALKNYRQERKQQVAEAQRKKITDYMLAVWMLRQRKAKDNKYKTSTLANELGLEQSWIDLWNKYLDSGNKDLNKIASLEKWRKLTANSSDPTDAEILAAADAFQTHLNFCLDERDGKLKSPQSLALYQSGKVDKNRPLVNIRVDLKGSQQLFLVVTNAGDSDNSDWGDWLDPKFVGPQGETSLLKIPWKNATAAHLGVRKNRNCSNKPLKVNNTTYEVGIGTHALSVIEYEVPAGSTHFTAQGGLDGSGAGTIEFRVYNAPPKDISSLKDSPERKAREGLLKKIFAENGLFRVDDKKLPELLTEEQSKELNHLTSLVETAKQKLPPALPMAHVVQDSGSNNLKVYLRGNPAKQGEEAPRRFLRIVAGKDRESFSKGSGRLELANAIASPKNPLTARVIVNRIWQHHFGRGLVGTASNFGALGDRPTHPELLDTLTVRFIESGWSMKWLHREIMRSAVYRLSSNFDRVGMQKDPETRLLWRMPRRRLEVEVWRDALLAVSGSLDKTMGGPTTKLSDSNNRRRTVYGAISRHDLNGLLRLFDFPDANVTSAGRSETTVPQQQLFVLNSDFVVKQSKALASRLEKEGGADPPARITWAYRILFGRDPNAEELALGEEFVSQEKRADDRLTPWEQYAQILLGSNEFLYID